jgi:hypothetical protein
MTGLVASGTHCISVSFKNVGVKPPEDGVKDVDYIFVCQK